MSAEALSYPWWIRLTHFFNLLFATLLIRSGIEIIGAHPKFYWSDNGIPGTEWLRLGDETREPIEKEERPSNEEGSSEEKPVASDGAGVEVEAETPPKSDATNDDLPIPHGGPLRLRSESILGYKMVKWVCGIEFVEDYEDIGKEQGGWRDDTPNYFPSGAGL